jgi:cell division protein FtsW
MINNNFIKLWWRTIDHKIIIILFIMFSFSMMLVTTASISVANRIGLDENYFIKRQIIYLIMSIFIIFTISLFNKKWIKRFSIVGFLLSFSLLVLVKFIGYEIKGSVRWMSIFGISIQPSEFIKPFFATMIGWILSLSTKEIIPNIIICSILYLIISFLLITQPDIGMLITITVIFCLQLFVAGIPIFLIIILSVILFGGLFLSYLHIPHVTQRINNFLDPAQNENYQITKSIKAFENGGLYGTGPGEGSIKHVLPDSHTDFIFAVAGEEFGALTCIIIIVLFLFIIIKIFIKLTKEDDKFVQLSVTGIIAQLGFQSFINIGVTLNLLPTKGMTLPFISYGGSSTIAISIAMGIVLGLTKRKTLLNKYKIQNIELL